MTGGMLGFVIVGIIAFISAFFVVKSEDPVRSAIGLVVNFLAIAVAYFMLGAEFLGITQVMVYAGAIMVLFLFVVMILKLGSRDKVVDRAPLQRTAAIMLGIALLAMVMSAVIGADGAVASSVEVGPDFGKPQTIGKVLFTAYVWPFLLASILLLVGVVGSILLAKRKG